MEHRGGTNVTVTYLEGRDEWGQNGEWVAQPEGDEYVLRVGCDSADIVVSEDLTASQRDATKVLTACFGDDWTVRREDGHISDEAVSISTWTCALRDRAVIDELLRVSRRVARMVRRYIPEVRCVHAKHLERDVQLVDWIEQGEHFYNTLRMSVVASASDLKSLHDMRKSHPRIHVRAGLWCIVGRNDTCEVFWTLQSAEPESTPETPETLSETLPEPASDLEEPTAAPDPLIDPATSDQIRRLRRAIDRVITRVIPAMEDPDSDAESGSESEGDVALAGLRELVSSAERSLAAPETLDRDTAATMTSQLKAAAKRV